ncbi:MAG: hypothetical protein KAW40_04690 [Candidatus Aenigmarchaeota archaeon]|nr:hypothetical protein [Candidatus Aenigmarchaeota archaeon]
MDVDMDKDQENGYVNQDDDKKKVQKKVSKNSEYTDSPRERVKPFSKDTETFIKELKGKSISDSGEEAKSEKGDSPGKKVKSHAKKSGTKVKEVLETDVDKLYELIRDKGILKVNDASKKLGIRVEHVERWGRILEEHKLIKLHYPPIGEPVLILKKFKSGVKEVKKLEKRKKLKPSRKVFIINLLILLGFIVFVIFPNKIRFFIMEIINFIKMPVVRISYEQAYLVAIIIIIIGIVVILMLIKRRRR